MKSTMLLLLIMLVFVAGTAWLAQEWRLEATTYLTGKERDGDVIRQQLVSEGDKARAETEMEFHSRGLKDSAEILASVEGAGRVKIADANQERTRLKSQQEIVATEYLVSPLQGTIESENHFLTRALDQNYSKSDRELNKTIYEIILESRMNVEHEYNEMLHSIGRAMSERPRCESNDPHWPAVPLPADPFARPSSWPR